MIVMDINNIKHWKSTKCATEAGNVCDIIVVDIGNEKRENRQ